MSSAPTRNSQQTLAPSHPPSRTSEETVIGNSAPPANGPWIDQVKMRGYIGTLCDQTTTLNPGAFCDGGLIVVEPSERGVWVFEYEEPRAAAPSQPIPIDHISRDGMILTAGGCSFIGKTDQDTLHDQGPGLRWVDPSARQLFKWAKADFTKCEPSQLATGSEAAPNRKRLISNSFRSLSSCFSGTSGSQNPPR
jgi:hypothetical protein